MNATEVREALRRHYGITSSDFFAEEWALLDEVALKSAGWTEARIDCLAVRAWSGMPKGHERVAIEIKVSKADYASEMKSGKWQHFYRLCHRFAFAVPYGLISVDDVPAECGLIEITGSGARWTRQAPRHEPEDLPEGVFAEVVRRLSRHEERLRRGDVDDPAAEIARLRLEVQRLEAQRRSADDRINKYREQVHRVLQDLGSAAICECSRPIKYHRGRKTWLHTDVPASDPNARDCSAGTKTWGQWARPVCDGDESQDQGAVSA